MFENSNITTTRTLRNIKKSIRTSLKEKYNIDSDEIVESILNIHGLDKKRFDFVSTIENVIKEKLNDISIDSNSNKNEKTIEIIIQESIAPVRKAIGYDLLYRKMKELYGKEEANRLTGELYDFSLGLSDSTNILKPYSYYAHTPIIVKINDKIQILTLKQLYDRYEHFSHLTADSWQIDTKTLTKEPKIPKAIINKETQKTSLDIPIKKITEGIVVEVWDTNKWVKITKILKHKNHTDMLLYQTKGGDFAFVTSDHPIYLENNNEKLAKQLKIGDRILKEDQSLCVTENIDIDTDLAYIIGFICGDGNIQSYDIDNEYINNTLNYIKFTRGGNLVTIYQNDIDNSEIVKKCKRIFKNTKFWKFNDSSDRQINFTSQWFNRICSEYFNINYKQNSFTKTAPANILSWTKKSKLAYLAGLIDSDGTVSKKDGRVDIRMRSYAVINTIYEILQTLNINGIKKRVTSDLMFGVAFRANRELLKYSEKIKTLPANIINTLDTYRGQYTKSDNLNEIVKIISDFPETFAPHIEEVYDITTSSGTFYANGMVQHNCWSFNFSTLVTEGRQFGQLYSYPAKRITSYVSTLCETIHQVSSHLAGAIAIGSFFLDVAHLLLYGKNSIDLRDLKTSKKYRKKLENEFQQLVHSVNHLSRCGSESPFTNLSIFDRVKLRKLVEDMDWYFPFDTLPIDHPEDLEDENENKEFYINYIIDYIIELQNIFLDFFDKGDPIKGGAPYRFPVVTINFSKKTWGEKILIEDTKFLKNICKREIYRYNLFVSEGTKVASCCRLLSDSEMLDCASQANSFGAGSSISLGSHRVCTINFYRIALESKTEEEFFNKLEERIQSTAKILFSHKELIRNLTEQGLQLFISNGWITLNRMFSTFGMLGLYEASILTKQKYNYDGDFEGKVLEFFNTKVKEISKEYSIIGNIEQIPAESFATRLSKADKLIFGNKKVPYNLYSNQFIPLWEDASIWEKMEVDGKYNKLITGGGIVHIQIGEKIVQRQAEKIIKYAVNCGCEHFALNSVWSECSSNHTTFGKSNVCPLCGSKIVEYYTRVVGFFTPVSSWQETRREWEFPNRTFCDLDVIDKTNI